MHSDFKYSGWKCYPSVRDGPEELAVLQCAERSGSQRMGLRHCGDVKVNGMIPYKYLKYLLKQMPRVGGRHSCGLLELLASWNPQVQEPCR